MRKENDSKNQVNQSKVRLKPGEFKTSHFLSWQNNCELAIFSPESPTGFLIWRNARSQSGFASTKNNHWTTKAPKNHQV